MQIEVVEQDSQQGCVQIVGRFDAYEAPEASKVFQRLLQAGAATIRVDLSATVFIDSTALAELVANMKRAREAGGDLVIVRPSEAVRVILELTALDKAFVIVEDARRPEAEPSATAPSVTAPSATAPSVSAQSTTPATTTPTTATPATGTNALTTRTA